MKPCARSRNDECSDRYYRCSASRKRGTCENRLSVRESLIRTRAIAGQRLEALERLCGLPWAVSTDDLPEVIGAARVAACLDHLEQPAGTKPRTLFKLLDDGPDERVGHRRRAEISFA